MNTNNITKYLQVASGQLISALVSLLSMRVYTELLSPEQFGISMLFAGLLLFSDGLLVSTYFQVVLSMGADIGNQQKRNCLVIGLGLDALKVIVPISGMAVFLLSTLVLERLNPKQAFLLAGLVSVYLIAEFAKTSQTAQMAMDQGYSTISRWQAVEALITLLVTGIFIVLEDRTAMGYLVGFVVGRSLSTALMAFWSKRLVNFAIKPESSSEQRLTAWKIGWPLMLMAPLGWATNYLDRYFVVGTVGVAQAGGYSAASALGGRPFALCSSVLTNYFRPKLASGMASRGARLVATNAFHNWLTAAAVVGTAGVIASYLLNSLIVTAIIALEYRAAVSLLAPVFALASCITICAHACDNYLITSRQGKLLLMIQIVSGIISVTSTAVAITSYGIVGGAWSRCAGEGFRLVLTMFACRKVQQAILNSVPTICE